MENKIKRFLELSKEFTVKSDYVYDGFQQNYNTLTINGNCGTYYAIDSQQQNYNTLTINGNCGTYYAIDSQQQNVKSPTKLEQFTKSQEEKIEKAKRYEEYLELQSSLLEYYTALEKLK